MLGLVLEGGGAKGAFHAGAVKALIERNYHFDGVSGTSIGALNGAMIAQGSFNECYLLWEQVRPSTLLDVDDEKFDMLFDDSFEKEDISYAFSLAKKAFANKGLSMVKVQEIVDKYINEETLRASITDYALVTVNISEKWKPLEVFKEDIPVGMLKKYILASAYYPAFNRPKIDGKSFIDGGMYDNCPINPLVRKGYDNIIVISTMSKMPKQEVIDKSIKIKYIRPSVKLGNTLDMRNKKIKFNLKLGYYDAFRLTDGLLGCKYYFKPFDESYMINFLESLKIDLFSKLSKIFSITGNKNTIINYLINEGKKSLYLQKTDDLPNSFASIVEEVAEENTVEKFEIYDIFDFIKHMRIKADPKRKNNNCAKVISAMEVLINALNEKN